MQGDNGVLPSNYSQLRWFEEIYDYRMNDNHHELSQMTSIREWGA